MDEKNMGFAKKLGEKYGIKGISEEVIASVYATNPKLPILLSRAAFRADPVRANPEISRQRGRRNFLRNVLGLMAISIPFLMGLKLAFLSPPPLTPSYVSGSQAGNRTLTNAANVPPNESLTFDDPTYGPFVLIHLDNGQFVAYSLICTHAGCRVQFNPYAKEISCPCHGAVFDPYNNAEVLAGPAPFPLQKIPISFDPSTRNIYLAG